jgi:hypothetical protein
MLAFIDSKQTGSTPGKVILPIYKKIVSGLFRKFETKIILVLFILVVFFYSRKRKT